MANLPYSPSTNSILVIIVASFPSCEILRVSQICLALSKPLTLLYSSLQRDANNTIVAWAFLWICSLIITGLSVLSKCIPFSTISHMLGWRERINDYAFYDSKTNSPLHQSVEVFQGELKVDAHLNCTACGNNQKNSFD
jgi:hypothetical protein